MVASFVRLCALSQELDTKAPPWTRPAGGFPLPGASPAGGFPCGACPRLPLPGVNSPFLTLALTLSTLASWSKRSVVVRSEASWSKT